jgi:hypothetical protein
MDRTGTDLRRERPSRAASVARTLTVIVLFLSGCGSPFRVPERVRIPPSRLSDRAHRAGLTIVAAAVTDEDAMLELFRANLRLAGLLPVYLEMTNEGSAVFELRRMKAEARDQTGRRFDEISANDALDALYEYYGIMLYRPASKKELKERFRRIAFALDPPLGPGEHREGILFFALPKGQHPLDDLQAVTLSLRNIRFADARADALSFEVILRYGSPR